VRPAALLPLFASLAFVVPQESSQTPLYCMPYQDGEKPKQDEPKPDEKKQEEPKPEELLLEITVAKRPASADVQQQDPNFKLKEPLSLANKLAEEEALRTALGKGLRYLLEQQQEDGTWKFDPKTQIREEVPKNERYFVPTANDSMNKVVLTSLCCMALRSHEELGPDRIRPAIAKGLEYVIENAPKHTKKTYGVWTWSFAIEFMTSEYKVTKDEALRTRIKESVAATVDRLLQNQRAGVSKPPAVLPKAVKKEPPKEGEQKKEKGYFGITPSPDGFPDVPGILVVTVLANGPASKGGVKKGDRILEINEVRITGIEHLYTMVAELPVNEVAKVKVLRNAPKVAGKAPNATTKEDGGWSYYTWSESAGNCTATAINAILDAKEIGVDYPPEAFDRATAYMAAMRLRREGEADEGFRYTMVDAGDGLDVRATVGRIAACTLALQRAGKVDAKELEKTCEIFVRRRGELDKVLGYSGNHVYTSFFNSPYYYFWSHYYSARAIKSLKTEALRKKFGTPVQEALLKNQYEDGTWVDHQAWGRVYGTAMALKALGELRFVAPNAYKKTLPMLKKREEYR